MNVYLFECLFVCLFVCLNVCLFEYYLYLYLYELCVLICSYVSIYVNRTSVYMCSVGGTTVGQLNYFNSDAKSGTSVYAEEDSLLSVDEGQEMLTARAEAKHEYYQRITSLTNNNNNSNNNSNTNNSNNNTNSNNNSNNDSKQYNQNSIIDNNIENEVENEVEMDSAFKVAIAVTQLAEQSKSSVGHTTATASGKISPVSQ